METIIGDLKHIDFAVKILSLGGVVAFPTETVYGLGGDCFNQNAVQEIYNVKGRPKDNPFIVHIASVDDLKEVALDVPDTAYMLFEKFSPGPLTLVLKKKPNMPLITTGGRQTVAVRIPNHPIALQLIKKSGLYLAAPSANISGRVSPTRASHVYEDFNGKIPLILDGGSSVVGIESTVLDLTQKIPVILRPGAIDAKMLGEVLDKVTSQNGIITEAKAPGMKYKHYSPLCDAIRANNPETAIKLYDACSNSQKTVIIGLESFIKSCKNKNVISLGSNINEAMSNLFYSLRYAEKIYDKIIIQFFDEDKPEHCGLNNRIKKATEEGNL